MKIRRCFVSNSSSSSFTINVKDLDPLQIMVIMNNSYAREEGWTVKLTDVQIQAHTYMDNYDFYSFLKSINVDMEAVHWID